MHCCSLLFLILAGQVAGRVTNFIQIIKRREAAFFGHIFRNVKYHFLKPIMEGKIEGKRGIDRISNIRH